MSIISYEKKFCFIHIYKTGGTTIRKMLENVVPDLTIRNPLHSSVKGTLVEHPYIREFFTFSYVRCPYDWMVSLYSYMKMPIGHPDYEEIKDLNYNDFLKWVADVGMKREEGDSPFYRTQTDLLFYRNKLFPNKVYKMEEMCNETGTSNVFSLFYNLGLDIPKEVPVINKSERPISWNELYNKETYKLMNTIFKDDFKNFRYKLRNA